VRCSDEYSYTGVSTHEPELTEDCRRRGEKQCDGFVLVFQHPHAQYAQYALSHAQNRPFFARTGTWILFGTKKSQVQILSPRRFWALFDVREKKV